MREIGTLRPGEIVDVNWGLSVDSLFYEASFGDINQTTGEFTADFPEGVEAINIDAWISEIDILGEGRLIKASYDELNRTGTFITNIRNSENLRVHPDNYIPKFYNLVPEFKAYIRFTGAYLDGGNTIDLETTIPVLARYMTSKNYMKETKEGVSDLNVSYKGAFKGNNNKETKLYSSKFIGQFTQNKNIPESIGPALSDFGFNQDVAIEKQATKMSFKLKNPSNTDFMRNITIKVIAADTMPNADGSIPDETRILTAASKLMANIKKGNKDNIIFDEDKGILKVKQLAPKEELDVEFSMEVPEGLNDMYNSLKDAYENYQDLFGDIDTGISKIYSWIDYSFDNASSDIGAGDFGSQVNVLDNFFGITTVSSQEVTAEPKIYISYELNPVSTDELPEVR